nr:tetratricopeptide repeat protein [Deltaproteobacteria bacterium]
MPDPAPTFGRYVVLDERVGDDGARTVVAYDPQLDRKVGLEVFSAASADAQDAIRDRARQLASVTHPNVVRVHDVGTHGDRAFAAMDFVEGKTLDDWIGQPPLPWSRVLEACLTAGEGLAAVHAVGLVHGEFGPSAVRIGNDGQVRVIGFVRPPPNVATSTDETGDRIAWCAMTFEALTGRPPGPNPEAVTGRRIPRRVRRLLVAGLSAQSQWGSMDALLAELRRIVKRRRRLSVVSVAATTTAAATAFVLTRPPPVAPAQRWCEGVAQRIDVVWNEDAATRARDAFVATEVPYAAQAWTAADAEVAVFVDGWREAQLEHCAPTPRRAPAPNQAATTICLHRQLHALEALTDAFQRADADLVSHAARTAASLGVPASCTTDNRDSSRYTDIDLDRLLEAEADLSAAGVQHKLGRFTEALTLAQHGLVVAQDLQLRGLLAEAHHGVARAHGQLGQEDAAERQFHSAFSEAVASGHHQIVARSALDLTEILVEQGRYDEADRWVEHAAAAVERDGSPRLEVELLAVRGLAAFRRSDNETAKIHYERSFELADAMDPPDEFGKIHANQALSNVMGRLGKTQRQIELLEEGMRMTEAKLGPEHPSMGHHYNSLAAALSRRGSTTLALDAGRRAVEIFVATFGEDHGTTISGRINLAATLHEAGEEEASAALYAVVLTTARRTFDDDDPRYANALGNVGMFETMRGNHEVAAPLLQEAATRNEAINGPDHVHTLGYLNNLAATYMFSDPADAKKVGQLVSFTSVAEGPVAAILDFD